VVVSLCKKQGTTEMKYYINLHSWEAINKFLSGVKGLHTKDKASLRLFNEAVWYIVRSGCQWRLLPAYYGDWRAVHRRFKRWADRGIWDSLMQHVSEPDTQEVMIDATIVRSHACSSGYGKNSQDLEALGRSAGGFTTKIHALVDALGNPLQFILTPGQRHDVTQAIHLTDNLTKTTVLADKGYDSRPFMNALESNECVPVIPPKRNRKQQRIYDQHVYKERHLIECFFGKIKHFRRIFSRFDKAAKTFLAFLSFVGALIWLR
jgi:transposase